MILSDPPTGITITSSLGTNNVESTKTISYTCTSSGGKPSPTVEFYQGSLVATRAGPAPTLNHSLVASTSMHGDAMKCRTFNALGSKEATETLTVFGNAKSRN